MSLYKRGNVYWSYIWVHGVRHARSMETSSKRQAEKRELDFRYELDLKRHRQVEINPEMPFSELATKFLTKADVKPHHVDRLNVLLPYFGSTPIGDISKGLAREFRRHRKNADSVSDTTVNRDLEVLRHVLFFAMEEGILLSNPLSRVQMVRERRKRQPVLSLKEEPLVLAAARAHLRPIIITALDTGMRRGEILHQKAEDVDLSRRILGVTKSKTPGGEQREIPLTARMHELLSKMPKTGLLFTYKRKPIQKLRRSWSSAVLKSGIRPLLFKHLRHTFNTRLMEAGVIQDVRNSLMGHSQQRARTTNDIYTHVEFPELRRAIQKLEAWIAREQEEIKRKEAEADQRQSEAAESAAAD